MKDFIYNHRVQYQKEELTEDKISDNPFAQFELWMTAAIEGSVPEPHACTLSTAQPSGRVSSRIVLLRGSDEKGFVFFTNYASAKGKQMHENPHASICFFWQQLEKQVRVEGKVEHIDIKDSEEYFRSRPRENQLGAWVSEQSTVIKDRTMLEKKYLQLEKDYANKEIPRPPHWGGYVLKPDYFEFWQGRSSRLHDRLSYTLENGVWVIERLSP